MEFFLKTITFILFAILIIWPIVLLNTLQKRKFNNVLLSYSAISIISTFLLFLAVAWWVYYSNEILMSHYGFDFDAMNFTEGLKNVTSENTTKINLLHKNRLGIGWPLKAFLSFPLYIPYLLFVYLGTRMYLKIKQKTNNFT